MIHAEYAIPHWWIYGLYEVVPFSLLEVWDGCGTFIANEGTVFISCPEEPISLDKKLELLRADIMTEVNKRLHAIGEVISVVIGNSIR